MVSRIRFPHLVEKAAELYLELRSTHKVAEELGIGKTTAWSYIKRSGIDMSAKNVSKIASNNKTIVVDGITFYWSKKGYYRGVTAPGRREMLSSYMYRKIHGTEKPKWLTIVFRDGNRDNYDPSNIYFVTMSEKTRIEMQNPERRQINRVVLLANKDKYFEEEKRNPLLKNRRMHRVWSTRRTNDPDNEWTQKMVETKTKNAEERGFFFTKEQRKHMSDAHIGNTKAALASRKNEATKAAIRAKLGMKG